jgi:hypothetical protein
MTSWSYYNYISKIHNCNNPWGLWKSDNPWKNKTDWDCLSHSYLGTSHLRWASKTAIADLLLSHYFKFTSTCILDLWFNLFQNDRRMLYSCKWENLRLQLFHLRAFLDWCRDSICFKLANELRRNCSTENVMFEYLLQNRFLRLKWF